MNFIRKLSRPSAPLLINIFVTPSKKMTDWRIAKSKCMAINIEEKRTFYKCGDKFQTISDVVDWGTYATTDEGKAKLASSMENVTSPKRAKLESSIESSPQRDVVAEGANSEETMDHEPDSMMDKSKPDDDVKEFAKSDELNGKISLFTGDITSLEIDAIVNAANTQLHCGGGVDFAIHTAAGKSMLMSECRSLGGCETGEAKITGGYLLPAKYVIHAVGPIGEDSDLLRSCYKNSMDLLKEHELETIAFPCISTGIYGYPNENAANVALETVRKWLDEDDYSSKVKRVIFCLFLPVDIKIYHKLLPKYFPF